VADRARILNLDDLGCCANGAGSEDEVALLFSMTAAPNELTRTRKPFLGSACFVEPDAARGKSGEDAGSSDESGIATLCRPRLEWCRSTA